MVLANLAGFIASCLVLVLSGALLVRCLIVLAAFLRLSQFAISFIIMAASTSLPELFVGISSALAQTPALALGTVIGSNIADVTLVAGIAILLARKGVIATREIITDSYWMFAIALLPLVLMLAGRSISRLDGVILLAAFLVHGYFMLKRHREKGRRVPDKHARWSVIFSTLGVLVFLPLLFLSAEYVVKFGMRFSLDLGIAPLVVGLVFVALGTSLPELAFEARAMRKGYSGLAFGDLIGSVVYNSTAVLGITALINPITANLVAFLTSSVMMLAVLFLFTTFLASGKHFTWREGISLILFYVLFLIVELNVQQFFT